MAGTINKYETIFILNPDLGEDKTKVVVEKFKNLLEASAQLEKFDEWGKRKLAYEIEDKNEGYYVLANFSAPTTFPRELERVYKITEDVIKYLVLKIDE